MGDNSLANHGKHCGGFTIIYIFYPPGIGFSHFHLLIQLKHFAHAF